MKRVKGDKYRPIVTIAKIKNGTPTVIQVSGKTYVLRHDSQFIGGGKRGQTSKV